MLVRTETPEPGETCGLVRARRTTSSTISVMNRGDFDLHAAALPALPFRVEPGVFFGDLDALGRPFRDSACG